MKVEKRKLNKHLPAILFGMLFAYVGFKVIRYRIELSRMDKDGVYVIAYVSGIGSSKNGKNIILIMLIREILYTICTKT